MVNPLFTEFHFLLKLWYDTHFLFCQKVAIKIECFTRQKKKNAYSAINGARTKAQEWSLHWFVDQ